MSKNSNNLIEKGIDLRRSGKYRESLETLKQAESDSALINDALTEMAKTYLLMGKLQQAKNTLTKALKLDPQSGELSSLMGEVLLLERKNDEAIKYFEATIKLQPDNIKASQSLQRLYYETKNHNAEHDLLVRLLPHHRNDKAFLYTYCICMLERSPKRDEQFVKQSLDLLKELQSAGFQNDKLEFFIAMAYYFLCEYDTCAIHIGNFLAARKMTSAGKQRYGIFFTVDANDAPLLRNHIAELEKHGATVRVQELGSSGSDKKQLIGAPIFMPGEIVPI